LHGAASVWRGVAEFWFRFLVADRPCGWLDEEAHQALDILRSRREENCSRANFIRRSRRRRNPI
jgi:hypothetical protein